MEAIRISFGSSEQRQEQYRSSEINLKASNCVGNIQGIDRDEYIKRKLAEQPILIDKSKLVIGEWADKQFPDNKQDKENI
jgi:hypothetical protein